MTVRVAFIGAGRMATSHVASLAALPEAVVVAMADVDRGPVDRFPRRRQEMARRLPNSTPRCRSRLGRPRTTPPCSRRRSPRPCTLWCLRRCAAIRRVGPGPKGSAHALVEKPLALQLPIAGKIVKEIKEKELIAGSGYLYPLRLVGEAGQESLIGDRTIGQVTQPLLALPSGRPLVQPHVDWGGQLTESRNPPGRPPAAPAGGVKTVFATVRHAARGPVGRERRIADDVQSVGFCLFKLVPSPGSTCNLLAPGHRPWEIRVDCEGFSLQFGGSNLLVKVIDDHGENEEPMEGDPLLEESRGFVNAVAQGRPELVLSTYESGVRTLAIACRRPVRTKWSAGRRPDPTARRGRQRQ